MPGEELPSLLQVRPLSEADAAAYHGLRTRSLDGLEHPAEAQVVREIQAGTDGIAALLASYVDEDTVVWGAFVGDTLSGAAALSRQSLGGYGDVGLLWGVFVLPRYRGTPASRLLMDAVIAHCTAESGIRQLRAHCMRDNVAGQQFLRRFGFEPISGNAVPGLILRRLLQGGA